jgi:hypothetical protein
MGNSWALDLCTLHVTGSLSEKRPDILTALPY